MEESPMFKQPTTVHIFKSTGHPGRYAATLDRNGANLPTDIAEPGKWEYHDSILIEPPDGPPRFLLNVQELADCIEKLGIYAWDIVVRTEIKKAPRTFGG
jgi:hypothetical protein